MSEDTTVTAVHEEDTLSFLAALGLDEAFKSGRLKCSVCEGRISERGLGAVRATDRGPIAACDDLECIRELQTK